MPHATFFQTRRTKHVTWLMSAIILLIGLLQLLLLFDQSGCVPWLTSGFGGDTLELWLSHAQAVVPLH